MYNYEISGTFFSFFPPSSFPRLGAGCLAGAWQTVRRVRIGVRDLILYRRECQHTLRDID